MEKYNFFYGSQMVEFERPKVPKTIKRDGMRSTIKPSITKAVTVNVYDKTK